MSLNRALEMMLRRSGRPVRYREGDRTVLARAWITPCTASRSVLQLDVTGVQEENRFIYLSASGVRAPSVGTELSAGDGRYRVEQSGLVRTGALDYNWAILVREEEEP